MKIKYREKKNVTVGAFEFFIEAIKEDKKNGVYTEPPVHENLVDILLKANGIEPSTNAEKKLDYMRTFDFWKKQFEDEEE